MRVALSSVTFASLLLSRLPSPSNLFCGFLHFLLLSLFFPFLFALDSLITPPCTFDTFAMALLLILARYLAAFLPSVLDFLQNTRSALGFGHQRMEAEELRRDGAPRMAKAGEEEDLGERYVIVVGGDVGLMFL